MLMPGIIVVSLLTVLILLVMMQVHPSNSDNSVNPPKPVNSTSPLDPPKPAVAAALDPDAVKAGRTTFMMVCAACHNPKATGIKGLGKPLIGSVFFNGHTDAELLAFLQTGRPVDDPLNTTGVMMPARGGRLTLTDDDLKNVIAYIRSLNVK